MLAHALSVSDITQLERKRNDLLAQMSILADGVSASFVATHGKRAKGEQKDPPRVDSLFYYWRERFDEDWPAVPDDPSEEALEWCFDRAERLVLQADADLKLRRGEVQTNVTPISGADDRDKRIIQQYEGYEPHVVAIYERCSTASVKTVRRLFQRDPMTGRR